MRILITGNQGFVGKETQLFLEKNNHEVIGFDLMAGQDIRDGKQVEEFIVQNHLDRILHLAAIARFSEADQNPKLCYDTNVLGTRNLAAMAGKYHIPIVYASTGSVYMPIEKAPPITEEFRACGNSVYGTSKYVGEMMIREYSHPWIVLRYAHLYGREKRGHGLIGGFLQRIERGLAPTLYGGKQSNDFTYIKDIAVANYLALIASWDKWNQNYNIGTGEELTAEEAGKIICEATGYKGEIEKKNQRIVDAQRFVFDTNKAEKMLGFKAYYKFRDGLSDMFSTLKGG